MEVSSALSVTRRKFSRNCSKNSTTLNNGDDFGIVFCLFWHEKFMISIDLYK
jgi:hypothetical protein